MLHHIATDLDDTDPKDAAWLSKFIAAGLTAIEERLEAERLMDEYDEPPMPAGTT